MNVAPTNDQYELIEGVRPEPRSPLFIAGQLRALPPGTTEEGLVENWGAFNGYAIVEAQLTRAEAQAFAARLNRAQS